MRKRLFAMALTAAMSLALLAGCGSNGNSGSSGNSGSGSGTSNRSVYYMNFKPEADQQWQALAKAYTEETGVPVTVYTAASGQYETSLKAEMAKSEAPWGWPAGRTTATT